MNALEILCLLVAVLGVAFAGRCYLELHRWARFVNSGRIIVSRKGRVVINNNVRDWVLWIRSLDHEKETGGRVLYSYNNTQVAIRKAIPPVGKFGEKWIKWRTRNDEKPQPRFGKVVATDQTPDENKLTKETEKTL